MLKASRGMGPGERHELPQRGPGGAMAENEFWRILELEKTHLIDTNLSFLTFLQHIFTIRETSRAG